MLSLFLLRPIDLPVLRYIWRKVETPKMAGSFNREWFWTTSIMERFSAVMDFSGITIRAPKHNLLSFLATAQALHLELLPITWQSARQELGIGATSTVNEALADLHTSFAFKRVQEKVKREQCNEKIFRVFTNEIAILSYPPIREHPHIAQLQGLCWDIEADGRVWPVLLFERSHYGDLYSFLKTNVGKKLNAGERLKFCVDIGKAISEMHSYSKPSNDGIFSWVSLNFIRHHPWRFETGERSCL